MNCEDYRQAIAADPSFDGGAGHLSECSGCQAYRQEMLELDRTINRALALDVPALNMPELRDVETDNVVALPRRRMSPPVWVAMAATVVLAAFVGFRMIGTGPQFESLGEELLAHIDHEQYALRVSDEPVSDTRLNRVVPAGLARLDHSAGRNRLSLRRLSPNTYRHRSSTSGAIQVKISQTLSVTRRIFFGTSEKANGSCL